MSRRLALLATAVLAALPAGAQAQDVYKIGASVGLTGYAAANDRFWRDGLNVAADVINAKGGILGSARRSRSSPRTTAPSRRKPSSAIAR